MYTALDIWLAVLGGLWVGACIGVIVGGINRAAKHESEVPLFHVPAAHREHEHEADGHYPRTYE
ncbi:hypothetical protein G3N58_15255 [Paraburkholderia sp. Ac-20342]|uniref:hypothetical protein n=1 Tax=Paraburkholderia sp. Ac-20342 TaxID=2703889 RepID=UPI00197E6E3B|nr:hypothetical protein [Paraburkholderia sp. Ac-20342]MBN3848178.1 hypothetical protein [Paraburkholderia sp. Ac-20342]